MGRQGFFNRDNHEEQVNANHYGRQYKQKNFVESGSWKRKANEFGLSDFHEQKPSVVACVKYDKTITYSTQMR